MADISFLQTNSIPSCNSKHFAPGGSNAGKMPALPGSVDDLRRIHNPVHLILMLGKTLAVA